MEKSTTSISTEHTDMIHDVKPDYYGKLVASCSSDRTIKVFEVVQKDKYEFMADLVGHSGPVWQLSWAHPRFGVLLASCSYDRKIIVWKQQTPSKQFVPVFTYQGHDLSVNAIEFAPQEMGLVLAAGSSDSTISVHTFKDGKWDSVKEKAHNRGVNCVSWSPAITPGLISSSSPSSSSIRPPRLASGGCDNLIKFWRIDESGTLHKEDEELTGHNDWVRDLAWAPGVVLPVYSLASGSQDGKVIVWTQSATSRGSGWKQKVIVKEGTEVVWRVSWSITGNILAVSSGDGTVSLWKEGAEEEWKCLSKIDEKEN